MNFIEQCKVYWAGDFNAAFYTDQGQRKENQDNYLLIHSEAGQAIAHYQHNQQAQSVKLESWPTHMMRLVVLDGLGGHPLARQITDICSQALLTIPPCYEQAELHQELLALHKKLYQHPDLQVESSQKHPATTLVWAEINQNTGMCCLISVGDSRAYLLRQTQWHCLTQDHNEAEFAQRQQRNCKNMPDTLSQAVGYGHQSAEGAQPRLDLKIGGEQAAWPFTEGEHFDLFTLPLQASDILLLATDGLWQSNEQGEWHSTNAYAPKVSDDLKQLREQTQPAEQSDNATLLCCSRQRASGGLKLKDKLNNSKTKVKSSLLDWWLIVALGVFMLIWLGISYRITHLDNLFTDESQILSYEHYEDQFLFEQLKSNNLLTVDSVLRLSLPASDWALQEQAAGQLVTEQHQKLLKSLYGSGGGLMLRKQVQRWNQSRSLAAVRDNNGTVDWQVFRGQHAYQQALTKVPEGLGFYHQNFQGNDTYSQVRTDLGDWFASAPQSSVRFVQTLSPSARVYKVQFAGDLIGCSIVNGQQSSDCQSKVIPICDIDQGINKLNECTGQVVHGGELHLAAGTLGELRLDLKSVQVIEQTEDKKICYQAVCYQASESAVPPDMIDFQYNAKLTAPLSRAAQSPNRLIQLQTVDGINVINDKGEVSQAARELGLLPLLGEASDYGSLPWLLARSGLEQQMIKLSIDSQRQKIAMASLQEGLKKIHTKVLKSHSVDRYEPLRQAALVVIDADNGDLLAAAGLPQPPLNISAHARRSYSQQFPFNTPFRNLIWQGGGSRQTPGSGFKVLTALMAIDYLEQNKGLPSGSEIQQFINGLSPRAYRKNTGLATNQGEMPIYDQDYQNRGYGELSLANYAHTPMSNYFNRKLRKVGCSNDSQQKNTLGLEAALMKSSNIWFAQLADKVDGAAIKALDFGQSAQTPQQVSHFLQLIERLGIDKPQPLFNFVEVPRNLASWKSSPYVNAAPMQISLHQPQQRNARFDLLQLSIGQSVQVTPLQMARIAGLAATANWPDTQWLNDAQHAVFGPVEKKKLQVKANNLSLLQSGMKATTEMGTARTAFKGHADQCRVYGKTGTAQVVKNQYNSAWFIGWREPINDHEKRLAFSCMVTHVPTKKGFGGGSLCATIIADWLKRDNALQASKKDADEKEVS